MQTKTSVIIIDDEFLARQRLKKLLTPYTDKITVIGEADNGASGLELIETLRPEFVFLDIQMPVMNGFEMLDKLTYQPFIVFATAFDEYAIKAFETNSIDYLLKPIRSERIDLTIQKIINLQKKSAAGIWEKGKLQALIEQLRPEKKLQSITVHKKDKIKIVSLKDILLFQSEDKLTRMLTRDEEKHLLTHSLNQLDQKLPDHFIRLNRSTIINENEVLEIQKGFNGKLVFVMKDKEATKITTGSSYTSSIKERLRF